MSAPSSPIRPIAGGSPLAARWTLDPGVDFLNHGSFGACPRAVLNRQEELRAELEREPVRFLARELPPRLDAARAALAAYLRAEPEDLVAVSNTTTGVNTVLRSLTFAPGDELLTTDHEYLASRNALAAVAEAQGARVVVARVPFPLSGPEEVARAVLAAATPRTRLLLIDHVTSPTGLVLPIEPLVRELAERGIDTLVDAAHAPGMLDLDVPAIGAAYYTGNCHKWLCAPKGAAFLWVRRDHQDRVRPLVVSHGRSARRAGRSRFHDEFDWLGTDDPTAFLCVPTAIDHVASLVPGGWPEVRERNRGLALGARRHLCEALGIEAPAPESMIGSLAAVPLPDAATGTAGEDGDPLQARLYTEWGIEVPVTTWPRAPHRLLRIAAQLYNREEQYLRLAGVLSSLLSAA